MTGFFVSVNQTGVERMTENNLAGLLLAWYEQHGRELPWRVKGGALCDIGFGVDASADNRQNRDTLFSPFYETFSHR